MRRADRGSATVWSLGLVGVLLAVFAAVLYLDRAVVARHRAGAAADLAALAAADHALDGEKAACALATRVADAQGADVLSCRLTGEVVDVVAEVGGARVASRAGPSLAAGEAADAQLRAARPGPDLPVGLGVPGVRPGLPVGVGAPDSRNPRALAAGASGVRITGGPPVPQAPDGHGPGTPIAPWGPALGRRAVAGS